MSNEKSGTSTFQTGQSVIVSVKTTMRSNLINVSWRTSLAGLALDSATSSGRGRAPRSAMQDPIQAPPGTTRQAGLYTS
ncbi:hypothetical protein TNCV_4531811 [Trichonephila clavipes]|nr:hypothetical protein TNCV_4531811 [Trichonephila clavipes]